MTNYFESRGEGWQHTLSEQWGPCRRLIEVADDQMAERQVEIYRSGQVLVYDRARARDPYGMLIGLRFSRKQKWQDHFHNVVMLTQADFEKEWAAAMAQVKARRST